MTEEESKKMYQRALYAAVALRMMRERSLSAGQRAAKRARELLLIPADALRHFKEVGLRNCVNFSLVLGSELMLAVVVLCVTVSALHYVVFGILINPGKLCVSFALLTLAGTTFAGLRYFHHLRPVVEDSKKAAELIAKARTLTCDEFWESILKEVGDIAMVLIKNDKNVRVILPHEDGKLPLVMACRLKPGWTEGVDWRKPTPDELSTYVTMLVRQSLNDATQVSCDDKE